MLVDTYPLFTVARLADSRAFFVDQFDMHVVFEATWVVMLAPAGAEGIRLGLMSSDHPSRPPGPEVFGGLGMILTVQVLDAGHWHERLRGRGVAMEHPLQQAPWGQRRFMVRDPSGIAVDVVEQTEPEPGFWEKYAV
jgi:uncharacterized glyoxalase superfamily protein PhnB